ncbi:MAG TPA: hypothetical protein VFX88_23300 [Actinomycetota bacterium]|nr:hypothetical protein [Actinomycetota bacterium]
MTGTSLAAGLAAGVAAAPVPVVLAGVVTKAGWAPAGSGAGRSSPHRDTSRTMETKMMATASQLGPRRPDLSPPTTRGARSNTGASGGSWAR